MKNVKLRNLVAGLTLGLCGVANAGVIFDNGTATDNSYRCSETSGACSGSWTLFDNFIVSSASKVSSVRWTTFLYGGLSDYNYASIWIYDNDPVFNSGSLLFTFSSVGNVTANQLGSNFFDITLSGFSKSLAAGTYWLGIQHNTTANYATIARSGSNNDGTQWQNNGSGYRINAQPQLAFVVEGTPADVDVPAPSTLAAFVIGMIGFAYRRFQKTSSEA